MALEKWLTSRSEYYGLWTVIFGFLYFGMVYFFQPAVEAWITLTSVFLVKDLYDEYKIGEGGSSLANVGENKATITVYNSSKPRIVLNVALISGVILLILIFLAVTFAYVVNVANNLKKD